MESFFLRARLAAPVASRNTVRMVPSTGLRTAWNATSTACAKAASMLAASTVSYPALPSHRPRKICEVMTPELPRAPMSAPVVIALRISAPSAPMGSCARFSTTVCNVSDMLVPVSPSGTGNTFRRLISSLRSPSVLLAAARALRRSLAV